MGEEPYMSEISSFLCALAFLYTPHVCVTFFSREQTFLTSPLLSYSPNTYKRRKKRTFIIPVFEFFIHLLSLRVKRVEE